MLNHQYVAWFKMSILAQCAFRGHYLRCFSRSLITFKRWLLTGGRWNASIQKFCSVISSGRGTNVQSLCFLGMHAFPVVIAWLHTSYMVHLPVTILGAKSYKCRNLYLCATLLKIHAALQHTQAPLKHFNWVTPCINNYQVCYSYTPVHVLYIHSYSRSFSHARSVDRHCV